MYVIHLSSNRATRKKAVFHTHLLISINILVRRINVNTHTHTHIQTHTHSSVTQIEITKLGLARGIGTLVMMLVIAHIDALPDRLQTVLFILNLIWTHLIMILWS